MYKNHDWKMASKRLEAFWHKEVIDRPCIQLYASIPASEPEPELEIKADTVSHKTYWTNPLAYFRANQRHFEHTVFMGEALASLYPNAEHVAMAMGSELEYDEGTVWIKKTPGDIFSLDFSHVLPEHPIILRMADYFERLCQVSEGECFVGFPHMGNPGDTLARMRGYDTLCLDLMDEPEQCFALEGQILRIWKLCYDLLYDIVNRHMQGSCGWLPAWHPDRSALIEFDFCALISPELFKAYIPLLVERAAHGRHAIYHLDGPGAIVHLDAILSIPEIGFIQWEPGAGGGDILDWIELMQKIQAAGKGLYVSGGPHPIWKAEILLRELRSKGIMLSVYASNPDEGERFLQRLCRA